MNYTLTSHQASAVLDWFEWATANKMQPLETDIALAAALYKLKDRKPPPRLRPFIPTDLPQTLPAGQMARWLISHNYQPDDDTGAWVSPDVGLDFMPGMWQYCGGTDLGGFKWLPEWFVQREV